MKYAKTILLLKNLYIVHFKVASLIRDRIKRNKSTKLHLYVSYIHPSMFKSFEKRQFEVAKINNQTSVIFTITNYILQKLSAEINYKNDVLRFQLLMPTPRHSA